MAKTITFVLAMSLLSIAPFDAFAQLDQPYTMFDYSAFYWVLYVVVAAGSVVVLLMATNSIQRPTSFASLPIYLFFALTIFVAFFMLSISFFPAYFFELGLPISTGPFTDPQNQTQWVLNIGGIPHIQNTSGLQIPIYVIIAGILGAYIRYLYIGISEFKESFKQDLRKFEDSYRAIEKKFDEYIIFTGKPCSPPYEIVISRGGGAYSTLAAILSRKKIDEQFEAEVSHLDEDPPPDRKHTTYSGVIPNPDDNSGKRDTSYSLDWKGYRRFLWSNIRNAQSEIKENRFIVGLEITTHILKTVGSFFLGPLLAVLAWLLLSIGGTDDLLTFALVSFAIGLTTKTIITRVMNFVGEKIPDESPSAKSAPSETTAQSAKSAPSETTAQWETTAQSAKSAQSPIIIMPSVTIDPKQARAGQLLTVRGKGFRANSRVSLQFDGTGGITNSIEAIQSSSKGEFDFHLRLPESLPKGTYIVSVEDEDRMSAKEAFTVDS